MAQTLDDSENIIYCQEGDDELSPFALKIYAMQYNDLVETDSADVNRSSYDNTFEMYADLDCENPFNIDSSLRQLTLLLNDNKCSQHDFKDIEKGKICLLKNVAEIRLTIFPTISLTTLQKEDVVNQVKNSIYLKYNARELQFGEEINYDDLFTNILNSSNLIKNISLNQIQYYTYALYYSDGEYLTIDVDSAGGQGQNIAIQDKWRQVCVSDEVDYIHMHINKNANGSSVTDGPNGQKWFNAYLGWSGAVQNDAIASQEVPVNSQYANKKIYLCDSSGIVYYLNEDN